MKTRITIETDTFVEIEFAQYMEQDYKQLLDRIVAPKQEAASSRTCGSTLFFKQLGVKLNDSLTPENIKRSCR